MKRSGLLLLVVSALFVAISAPASAVESHKIGKKAPSGALVFVVHGFADPAESGSEFLQPDPGTRFVAVDVEVINPTDESQAFSSLLGFSLLTKDRREFATTLTLLEPGPPDGQIAPKFGSRGWVSFEVPVDGVIKFFRAKGNLTASGALIKLKVPKATVPATAPPAS